MVQKWYEVYCDNCGNIINHFIGNRPSKYEIENDGGLIWRNKTFCGNRCLEKYKEKYKEITTAHPVADKKT